MFVSWATLIIRRYNAPSLVVHGFLLLLSSLTLLPPFWSISMPQIILHGTNNLALFLLLATLKVMLPMLLHATQLLLVKTTSPLPIMHTLIGYVRISSCMLHSLALVMLMHRSSCLPLTCAQACNKLRQAYSSKSRSCILCLKERFSTITKEFHLWVIIYTSICSIRDEMNLIVHVIDSLDLVIYDLNDLWWALW